MALTRQVQELINEYKQIDRQPATMSVTEYVCRVMTLGMRVGWLADNDQSTYYREIAKYRDALWRAEHEIEWPN